MRLSWRKANFNLQVINPGYTSWIKDGGEIPTYSVLALHLVQTCTDHLHSASVSMSLYILEGFDTFTTSIHSGSCSLTTFSSTKLLQAWRGFDGHIPFMTGYCSVSHSVFVPISYCRHRLLWWWLDKAQMYEYSRMLLRVVLLLKFFSRIIVFPFTLGTCLTYFQTLGHPCRIRCGFHFEWTSTQIRYWLVTPLSCFMLLLH